MQTLIAIIVIVAVFSVLGYMVIQGALPFIGQAFGQVKIDADPVKDPIDAKDLRKSFGYCPDSSILDKYGVTYTLESCPLSRLYVDGWDKLDDNTKQTIYNELTANGWRVEKE